MILANITISKVQIGGRTYNGLEIKFNYIDQLASTRANLNMINSIIYSLLWEYDEDKIERLTNMADRMDVLIAEMTARHKVSDDPEELVCNSCHSHDSAQALLKKTAIFWQQMKTIISTEIIPLLENEDPEQAGEIIDGNYTDLYSEIMGSTKDEIEELRNAVQELRDYSVQTTAQFTMFYLAGGAISTLLVLLISFFFVQKLIKTIYRIVDELDDSTNQITSEATNSSESSITLNDMAGDMASSIEETSASLEEIYSMVRRNDDNLTEANTSMAQNSILAEQATLSMDNMQKCMDKIKNDSDNIKKFIKEIEAIAFQTNLLALNAAVEAARAGEAGAGFAVVAAEVRNLAKHTAEAAHNSSELIQRAITNVDTGLKTVQSANEEFIQINTGAKNVGNLIAEIATASHEQAQGLQQIKKAIGGIDSGSQQLAANSDQNAGISKALMNQSDILRENIHHLNQLIAGK
ncbi:MAG: hypothetical protein KKB30_00940 [Proteobacteria bacterium]|nr:hypothetical protein [Pseudomonadota bacterium]MBU1715378.1 hypothetical protein [Pseudomonadota bacterium]